MLVTGSIPGPIGYELRATWWIISTGICSQYTVGAPTDTTYDGLRTGTLKDSRLAYTKIQKKIYVFFWKNFDFFLKNSKNMF